MTPETLAVWRVEYELGMDKDCPDNGCLACTWDRRTLALMDAAAEEKARADENEKRRARAERRADKAEAAYAALVARRDALADEWEAEAQRACGDTSHYGYSACPDCGSAGYAEAIRALTEKEQDQ